MGTSKSDLGMYSHFFVLIHLPIQVRLARIDEEEEVNGNGEVEHVDGEPLVVTWSAHDAESGINKMSVCVWEAGTHDCFSSAPETNKKAFDSSVVASTTFTGLSLNQSSDDLKVLYKVYVIVVNNAGVASSVQTSRSFLVVRANVPGVVHTGRTMFEGHLFSYDKAAIAITFSGFSSDACSIVGYEWAVGTKPFYTDVLPYTDFGLVVDDSGLGYAQTDMMQFESQTYFATVRARTGQGCHESYIVSSSEGFMLDTTPPTVTFRKGEGQMSSQVVYQTVDDKLAVLWESKDPSGINSTRLILNSNSGLNSNPHTLQVPPITDTFVDIQHKLSLGESLYITMLTSDNAGNEMMTHLPLVTFDSTPPSLTELTCTDVISALSPLLTCRWLSIEETESALQMVHFGLGRGRSSPDLLNMTSISVNSQQWSVYADFVMSSTLNEMYVLVMMINGAGLQAEVTLKVTVDHTPPTIGSVIFVSSPQPGYHENEQKCQTSQDYMEICIKTIIDDEAKIDRYERKINFVSRMLQ